MQHTHTHTRCNTHTYTYSHTHTSLTGRISPLISQVGKPGTFFSLHMSSLLLVPYLSHST